MEFARRAAPQKIARKARFMKSSRIREKSPDLRYFADITYVFLDRIVKASQDRTLRPVHVQELGPARHIASSRVPNCFTSILMSGFKLRCDSHHILPANRCETVLASNKGGRHGTDSQNNSRYPRTVASGNVDGHARRGGDV